MLRSCLLNSTRHKTTGLEKVAYLTSLRGKNKSESVTLHITLLKLSIPYLVINITYEF